MLAADMNGSSRPLPMRDIKKYLARFAVTVLILLAVLYVADWLVLRYRVGRGTAFDSVEVDQFLATPLKGNKAEYDFVGSYQQPCARSMFPQQGKPPCWWVRRHTAVWE
jgi:hypothetical protein